MHGGKQAIEKMVPDFLQAWLVEGKPEVAASYFSTNSCSFSVIHKVHNHKGAITDSTFVVFSVSALAVKIF